MFHILRPRLQLSDLQSALASIQGQGQSSSGGSAAGGTSGTVHDQCSIVRELYLFCSW